MVRPAGHLAAAWKRQPTSSRAAHALRERLRRSLFFLLAAVLQLRGACGHRPGSGEESGRKQAATAAASRHAASGWHASGRLGHLVAAASMAKAAAEVVPQARRLEASAGGFEPAGSQGERAAVAAALVALRAHKTPADVGAAAAAAARQAGLSEEAVVRTSAVGAAQVLARAGLAGEFGEALAEAAEGAGASAAAADEIAEMIVARRKRKDVGAAKKSELHPSASSVKVIIFPATQKPPARAGRLDSDKRSAFPRAPKTPARTTKAARQTAATMASAHSSPTQSLATTSAATPTPSPTATQRDTQHAAKMALAKAERRRETSEAKARILAEEVQRAIAAEETAHQRLDIAARTTHSALDAEARLEAKAETLNLTLTHVMVELSLARQASQKAEERAAKAREAEEKAREHFEKTAHLRRKTFAAEMQAKVEVELSRGKVLEAGTAISRGVEMTATAWAEATNREYEKAVSARRNAADEGSRRKTDVERAKVQVGEALAIARQLENVELEPGAQMSSAPSQAEAPKSYADIESSDRRPWWQLDLGRPVAIYSVALPSRMHGEKRLAGASAGVLVRLGAGNGAACAEHGCTGGKGNLCPPCSTPKGVEDGLYEVSCGGRSARYVYVQLLGAQRTLRTGDVHVFGAPDAQSEAGGIRLEAESMLRVLGSGADDARGNSSGTVLEPEPRSQGDAEINVSSTTLGAEFGSRLFDVGEDQDNGSDTVLQPVYCSQPCGAADAQSNASVIGLESSQPSHSPESGGNTSGASPDPESRQHNSGNPDAKGNLSGTPPVAGSEERVPIAPDAKNNTEGNALGAESSARQQGAARERRSEAERGE